MLVDAEVRRCALAYVSYFAYLGSWGPLWTTWLCKSRGFDQGFVGWLAALLVLSLLLGGTFFARLADRSRCRRRLQRALSFAGALCTAGWLWVRSEEAALALIILQGVTCHTHSAMLDANRSRHMKARMDRMMSRILNECRICGCMTARPGPNHCFSTSLACSLIRTARGR